MRAENSDAFRRGSQRLAYALARCSSGHIVAIECGCERDSGEEIFLKLCPKLVEFVEGKRTEFDTFFNSEAHGMADLLVCRPEGNSLVDEIGGRGHGIQVALLRSFVHALAIELESGGKARD